MSKPSTAQMQPGGDPLIPKFVGKYRIVRLIAKSNDTVYEAIDPHLNRHIALKELTLPPNLSGAVRRERIERFQREAKAAGALTHPHIVTIYEVGQHLEHRFIAMEYLVGQTLREVLTVGGPMPVLEAIEITLQLCEALGYAHLQGVVHRDVKPDNIYLVAPDRTVKLTDFGIARVMAEPSLTTAGQVFGTPAYMSPEQLTSREVDYRSDIFSLGIVLYEMLTGHKPFQGDSIHAITYQIMNAEPEIPSSLPPGLGSLLTRTLAKDPDLRPQSMRALAADLRREQRSLQETPALEQTALLAAAAQTRHLPGSEPTLSIAGSAETAATLPAGQTQAKTQLVGDELAALDKPRPAGRASTGAPAPPSAAMSPPPSLSLLGAIDADATVRRATIKLMVTAFAACLLAGIALIGFVPRGIEQARDNRSLTQAASLYRAAGQLAGSGNMDEAIAKYTAALQIGGPISDLFADRCRRGLADCYTAQAARAQAGGDLPDAQGLYAQATGWDTQNATAHYDYATLYQANGDTVGALREFTLAHQADPDSTAGQAALSQAQQGYLQLAEQDFTAGNTPQARQNWQRVIDLAPQSLLAQQAAARLQQTQ